MSRTPLSAAEVDEVWRRWRSGQAVKVLAREIRRNPSTVRDLLKRCGGVRPVPRRRGQLRLSPVEREQISRGPAAGQSLHGIARGLGRAPSTVSREVAGNGGRLGCRAVTADQAAWARAVRPKPTKLSQNPQMAALVAERLAQRWSPQQIAGWLRRNPQRSMGCVSHETIYRALFIQARGDLRHEWTHYLRKPPAALASPANPKDAGNAAACSPSRSARPKPPTGAVPGHWEGDLLCGHGPSCIATLVERSTRFLMLVSLPDGKRADRVAAALAARIVTLPAALRRTLTWDQGFEMAEHARFTVATGVPVYFCDPHSPWQCGSNENTNGLVRPYLPRAADLRHYTQHDLDAIADELNRRPRQTLGFRTPSEALNEVLR